MVILWFFFRRWTLGGGAPRGWGGRAGGCWRGGVWCGRFGGFIDMEVCFVVVCNSVPAPRPRAVLLWGCGVFGLGVFCLLFFAQCLLFVVCVFGRAAAGPGGLPRRCLHGWCVRGGPGAPGGCAAGASGGRLGLLGVGVCIGFLLVPSVLRCACFPASAAPPPPPPKY